MGKDLIERQAAINAITLGKEILSRVLDDMDVIGQDREKYSWGLGLIESNIADIKELPSTQPLSEADLTELEGRFGKYVRYVVEDMISGKGERWKT